MDKININVKGVDLEVLVYVEAASMGARELGTGLQLEPDEAECIHINAVFAKDSDQDIWELLSTKVEDEIQKEVEAELAWRELDAA